MSTVLILATDQMIGGLLGQLTELAGHAAQFPGLRERPEESVTKCRPNAVLVDADYGEPMTSTIADAAGESGAVVVYFAASQSLAELRAFAEQRHAPFFPLPAGPKLLHRVLEIALGEVGNGTSNGGSPAQQAVVAAMAAVDRARTLADRATELETASFALRSEREVLLAECRRSAADLREAVIAYTRELRWSGVPPDQALEKIKKAMSSELGAGAAGHVKSRDLDDATEWCLQAYYAA